MKTILVYDDNPDFGGHQLMATRGVEALAADPELDPIFFYNPQNSKLAARLQKMVNRHGNLGVREVDFKTSKFQGIANRFSQGAISKLSELFAAENPDLLLCIQGEIEDSSLAVLAGSKAAYPCLSYIPIPHKMRTMGAKFGRLRDYFNRYLFHAVDGCITISQSMADILRTRGVSSRIEVVQNGIDSKALLPVDPKEARRKLGLNGDSTLIGMIGRIEFKQKRQDFFLKAVSEHPDCFESADFVIVGEGPDTARLRKLIAQLGLDLRVQVLPWSEDTLTFYSAIDYLALPSRFEGVPLVMLEALACGVPVFASRRDGMRDILPDEWLFDTEDAIDMAATFKHMREGDCPQINDLQNKVRNELTLEKFQVNFSSAIKEWLE